MIAVDTNLLVYAHREDSPHHAHALAVVTELARGRQDWAITWPSIHEFLSVVTHPRIYQPATAPPVALEAVTALTASPRLRLLAETPDHMAILTGLMASGTIVGPRVHDARIAAICLGHGVASLLSADRDFSWFPALKVVNPLAS